MIPATHLPTCPARNPSPSSAVACTCLQGNRVTTHEQLRVLMPPPVGGTRVFFAKSGVTVRPARELISPPSLSPEDYPTIEEFQRVDALRLQYRICKNHMVDCIESNNIPLLLTQLRYAIELLIDHSTDIFPDVATCRLQISDLYATIGRYLRPIDPSAAFKNLQYSLEFSENDMAYNSLGLLYQKQGNFAKEKECYLDALRTNPHSHTACVNLGILYAKAAQTDPEQAIHAHHYYTKAVSINPSNDTAWSGLANCYLLVNRPDEALFCINKAILLTQSQDRLDYQLTLANCYRSLKNFPEGRALLEHLQQKAAFAKSEEALFAIEVSFTSMDLSEGKIRECESRCLAILEKKPNEISALVNLISARFLIGDPFTLQDTIEYALEARHPFLESSTGFFYAALGYLFFHTNNLSDAFQAYENHIEHTPKQYMPLVARGYAALGAIAFEQQQYEESIQYYLRALEKTPHEHTLSSIIHSIHLLIMQGSTSSPSNTNSHFKAICDFYNQNPHVFLPEPPGGIFSQQMRFPNRGTPEERDRKKPSTLHFEATPPVSSTALPCRKWFRKTIGPNGCAHKKLANQLFYFVIQQDNENGKFLIKVSSSIRHYNLAGGGKDVKYAGVAVFEGGDLVHWSNSSGHYLPEASEDNIRACSTMSGFPKEKFVDMQVFKGRLENAIFSLGTRQNYQRLQQHIGEFLPKTKRIGQAVMKEYRVKFYSKG